jgi:isocitrate dehydrogenase kinase/phosphatase
MARLKEARRPCAAIAARIAEGYCRYMRRYHTLTRRAAHCFLHDDVPGAQALAAERLDAYQAVLDAVVADLQAAFPETAAATGPWPAIKAHYARRARQEAEPDLAETFFNSVARRCRATMGVDPATEFVRSDTRPAPAMRSGRDLRTYRATAQDAPALWERILSESPLGPHLADLTGDARRLAEVFAPHLAAYQDIQVLSAVFYRGMGAYLIGCVRRADRPPAPLGIALINAAGRIVVDGIITDDRDIRVLFSFTHSYFLVDNANVSGTVAFLQALLPHRRRSELFISLGFNRHGKSELYRELQHHQNVCPQPFAISPGKRGMVMAVFNQPDDDLVFKVIRDRFDKPKHTTPGEVRAKYAFVFRHDRTGRLPDTQSFENLQFATSCFGLEVRDELRRTASRSIIEEGGHLTLSSVYIERRVTPLDLYLESALPEDARSAVIDFGQAIKDMAASDIFPGDMLLKNFGVTTLGRVIFYDFDEICPLHQCRFRRKPRAFADDALLDEAPWYLVEENDVFPEEFIHFLGLRGQLREAFLEHHADLCGTPFWLDMQTRLAAGELLHLRPYRPLPAAPAHRSGTA